MNDEIYIDVNYLTESERDIILQVLARDDDLRRQEKKRLSHLKSELDLIKFSGLESKELTANSRVCARCRAEFGVLFNTGAFCPKCKVRVCKNCRTPIQNSWICLLCSKVRDVKANSGAWFFEQGRKRGEKPTLYGSVLLRASLKRVKRNARQEPRTVIAEPPPPPVINLNLSNHENLRRPIPVHMSPLKEKTEPSNLKEDSIDGYDVNEVNRNYKPYSKAVPIKHTEKEAKEEEDHENKDHENKDEDRSSRSSSGNSTPTPQDDSKQVRTDYDITINGHTGKEGAAAAEEERPILDFLKEEQEQLSDDSEGYSADDKFDGEMDDLKGYTSQAGANGHLSHYNDQYNDNNNYMRDEEVNKRSSWQDSDTYEHHDNEMSSMQSQNKETHILPREPKSSDSLKTDSLDTATTGDFITPKETPVHSDASTLVPVASSDVSDNDADFQDAREDTPVPESSNNEYGEQVLPEETEETDSGYEYTYSSNNIVPPQIITTAVSDEDELEEQRTTGHEELEDIDQAFADYGVDMSSQKLAERLDMGSRESIVSYYSEAGEGNFGNIPVTGEVQLGFKYDYKAERLEVQVHCARDIAAVDTKKKKSDPYIKVYMLPDKTKGGKRKTKTKKHTLNPTFDEILMFDLGFDEMLTRIMWLTVWNHDRFGHNDFLGEVMLSMDTYEQSGFSWDSPSAEWFPLRERRPEPSLLKYCGELMIALKYVPSEAAKGKKKKKKSTGELHVVIKEARNLSAKDANGFSDPFCKAYLLPDRGRKSKKKTPTIRKNLNPQWNHGFVYEDITLEELMDRALELTVWDWDRGSSNDFLGGVRLGMGTKMEKWDDSEGEEITAWQAMLDFPNEWHDSSLTLRSSMDSRS